MQSKSLLIAAAALGLSGAAFAATETRPNTSSPAAPSSDSGRTLPSSPDAGVNPNSGSSTGEFFKLDADGDGTLSKKEGAKNKSVQKQWSKLDANKDGKLDTMEFSQFELTPLDDTPKR